MNYFLLEHACENRSRSKIRVSKWLGVEPPEKYHRFLLEWHDFRHEMVDILSGAAEEQGKQLNLHLLRTFFLSPYDTASDFYPQFSERGCISLIFGALIWKQSACLCFSLFVIKSYAILAVWEAWADEKEN